MWGYYRIFELLGKGIFKFIKKQKILGIATHFLTAIHKPLGLCKSNCTNIHKVAIISGGGTNEIDSAYLAGADLYITGDASHVAWLRAKELGINLIFAGHYFTEVWGVLALAEHLLRIFDIKGVFIDEATRL